jgi:hypothetical protein
MTIYLELPLEDIAAAKLYDQMELTAPKDRDWVPIAWGDLHLDQKEYYRRLVRVVRDNYPAPIDGEVRVRLPGQPGTQDIVHIFRCDVTKDAIEQKCKELRHWLMDLTENYRR